MERSPRSAIKSECTVISRVDKLLIALVRRSKKAVSEASGIMYSRAELFRMYIELRITGPVTATHESAGEFSTNIETGTQGFTSRVRIRVLVNPMCVTYHGIHIHILVDNKPKPWH